MEAIPEKELKIIYSQDKTGQGGITWDLEKNNIYGRYMVALRDINPGELIFQEVPLVFGPSVYNPVLICLGCTRHMIDDVGCVKCGWPLCSEKCPLLSVHRTAECTHLAKYSGELRESGEFDLNLLNSILYIRIILLKNCNKDAWNRFHVLDSMLEAWKETGFEDENENIKLIRDKFGIKICSEEEVLTVISTCSTNAFSKYLEPGLITSEPDKGPGLLGTTALVSPRPGEAPGRVGTKARVMFLLSSMMSHSCFPNAEQTIGSQVDGMQFELRATRPILKGEQIQISYVDLLEPTLIRQYNLLKNKLFVCSCIRCMDPRELGSNCGVVKCLSCIKQGTQPPGELLSSTKDMCVWTCSRCGVNSSFTKVRNLMFKINEEVQDLVNTPSTTIQEYEKFLGKYGKILNPKNGLLLKSKYQLCGMYGRVPGYTLSGLILYELHASLILAGRTKLQTDRKAGVSDLKLGLKYLQESLEILKTEPRGTLSYKIYQGGQESLSQVQQFVISFL
ncbi:protein msta isoform X2 [Eurytemora carolleeae]|uniref:protein msta isoform X2 n=1 Tax=Eurytemora carolleeae TaxID=1294199 RepID=UPI000C783DFA|nr:protein msta isoform X2 [Eurytemora carolleeae]|eukprot:XP_023320139.1 protein msta-like isoform X2 [Eurytemora affinis]